MTAIPTHHLFLNKAGFVRRLSLQVACPWRLEDAKNEHESNAYVQTALGKAPALYMLGLRQNMDQGERKLLATSSVRVAHTQAFSLSTKAKIPQRTLSRIAWCLTARLPATTD